MEIVNQNYQKDLNRILNNMKKITPTFDSVEVIDIQQCLGFKTAEEIVAMNAYPENNLSGLKGMAFNLEKNIDSDEDYNKFKVITPYMYRLRYGKNPYITDSNDQYQILVPPLTNLKNIANTVVALPDSLRLDNGDFFEVKKEIGIVEKGNDYVEGDLILGKDEIITPAKKALLIQAGISKIKVYKKVKLAVLYVDYEDFTYNTNINIQYIQDSLLMWGFDSEILKVKPFHLNENVNEQFEFDGFTTSLDEYQKQIDEILTKYDFIIGCGMANDGFHTDLGLFRKTPLMDKVLKEKLDQFPLDSFHLIFGKPRSPSRSENIYIKNAKGELIGSKIVNYEDRSMLLYLPGYIEDLIFGMNLIARQLLLHRIYSINIEPNWKIGVISEDCEFNMEESNFIWANYSLNDMSENSINNNFYPYVNIKYTNTRPDQLNFLSECNCFIPIKYMSDDKTIKFKSGDFVYFIEI
nr:hypothetical protein [Acinetobacter sp. Marseille-Q1620]